MGNNKNNLWKNDISQRVEERRNQLEKLLDEKVGALKYAPEGSLCVDPRGGTPQYYHHKDHESGRGEYIRSEKHKLVVSLAQKDYDKKVLQVVEQELKVLNRFKRQYKPEKLQEIYENLREPRRNLVVPDIITTEEFVREWQAVEYTGLEVWETDDKYQTLRGEYVRSKSEIIIADALYRNGVPYRYEYPLKLTGLGTVHPDFMCLNVRERKEVYWEHFGMMDDEIYANKAINKLEKYMMNGYPMGDRFIATFESGEHPTNSRLVEQMIRLYLL